MRLLEPRSRRHREEQLALQARHRAARKIGGHLRQQVQSQIEVYNFLLAILFRFAFVGLPAPPFTSPAMQADGVGLAGTRILSSQCLVPVRVILA